MRRETDCLAGLRNHKKKSFTARYPLMLKLITSTLLYSLTKLEISLHILILNK